METDLRNSRVEEIKKEDFIYGIFVIIIILSYIANNYEKKYFVSGKEEDRIKYYYLQIFVFLVVVIINIYYVLISYKDVSSLYLGENYKSEKYVYLTFVASLFALIAGLIILYIAITDIDIDAELSL